MWGNDMDKDHIDRIRIQQRRQKGRLILSNWIRNFKSVCNLSVTADDFLELEETERLKTEFYGKVRDSEQEPSFILKEEFDKLLTELEELGKQNDGQIVFIFHDMDRFIGALKLNCKVVFEHVNAIWSITKEDLSVVTSDLKNGLCLEKNYYDQYGSYVKEGIYELTAWGTLTK